MSSIVVGFSEISLRGLWKSVLAIWNSVGGELKVIVDETVALTSCVQ